MIEVKLFPRKPGTARDVNVVLRAQAHRILDAVKRGERVSDRNLTWALHMTGDACPSRVDRHGDMA